MDYPSVVATLDLLRNAGLLGGQASDSIYGDHRGETGVIASRVMSATTKWGVPGRLRVREKPTRVLWAFPQHCAFPRGGPQWQAGRAGRELQRETL